jgi:hypothetical protein
MENPKPSHLGILVAGAWALAAIALLLALTLFFSGASGAGALPGGLSYVPLAAASFAVLVAGVAAATAWGMANARRWSWPLAWVAAVSLFLAALSSALLHPFWALVALVAAIWSSVILYEADVQTFLSRTPSKAPWDAWREYWRARRSTPPRA